MRTSTLLVFCLLCLVPPVLRAEEEEAAPRGDPVTAQVPRNSAFVLRVASLDRVDAVAKEIAPLLKAMGMAEEAAVAQAQAISGLFFQASGLDAATIDRSKPVYFALGGGDDPVFLFHAAAGASWEGTRELQKGHVAVLRGDAVVCTTPRLLDAEPRGTPTEFRADGDIVVHVYLGDLVERHKDAIEAQAAQAAMMAGAQPTLPDAVKAMILPLVSGAKDLIFAVDSLDYALTWKEGRLDSEGVLATKPRTGLRRFLQRAGAPGDGSNLVGYLPTDAFLYVDSVTNADWPLKEVKTLLDAAAGEGTGQALLQLAGASSAFAEHLTGRNASSVSLGGMMMMASTRSIAELKEGADFNALMENFDAEAANAALKKLGLPLSLNVEKAVAKHGETPLHRMTISSEDPNLAMMMSMMQTYIAAEGRHLLTVMSPTAEDDIRGLLDTVRQGQPAEHPHAKAMARLGPHNIGFTFNAGAIKQMLMMMVWAMPPAAQQAVQNVPNDLFFSTAVTMNGGDLHWRGDWPVQEIAKIAQAITAAQEKKEKEEEEEEDFD
ncbi:MAG: hypothetical protein ACYTEZ_02125 [Planctomycetota bacterium]|jgi:hypothetical protein